MDYRKTVKKKLLTFLMTLVLTLAGAYGLMPLQEWKAERSTGDVANLVIFAYFQNGNDESYKPAYVTNVDSHYFRNLQDSKFFQDKRVADKIINIYQGPQEYSFTEYMSRISDGKLTVHNVMPQFKDTKIIPYCIRNTSLSEASSRLMDDSIVTEIMQNVDLPADARVDYDNDGVIDNLTVVLRGGMTAGDGTTMHAHKTNYIGAGTMKWKGTDKYVSPINMINTYTLMERSTFNPESALIAHEFMHSIGFPDLYSSNANENPVAAWDVMSGLKHRPSYPLAYMRMNAGKWMDASEIPVVTSNQKSFRLYAQNVKNETRAVILKSPYSTEEFFVVEFRKKSEGTPYTIDSFIGGSGIIVYRINTSVPHLSNFNGETGVYVFKLQKDDKGYIEGDEDSNTNNAFFSSESGRTEIGSANMNDSIADGAIAFSDGANSGIVISRISSAAGNSIDFDITFPTVNEQDAWKNTGFVLNPTGESGMQTTTDLVQWNNSLYMAVCRENKVQLWSYESNKWSQKGNAISGSCISDVKLVEYKKELYLMYSDYSDKAYLYLMKYNPANKTWSRVTSLNSKQYYDVAVVQGNLYVAHEPDTGSFSNYPLVLSKLNGNSFEKLHECERGFLGSVKICDYQNNVYVMVKNVSSNGLSVFLYQPATNMLSRVSTGVNDLTGGVNFFDAYATANKMYVALGTGKTCRLLEYNGATWNCKETDLNYTDMKISGSNQKSLFFTVLDPSERMKVFGYDVSGASFIQEGVNVCTKPSHFDTLLMDNNLYISYVNSMDRSIHVVTKSVNAGEGNPVAETIPLNNSLRLGRMVYIGTKFGLYYVLPVADYDSYTDYDLVITSKHYDSNFNIIEKTVTINKNEAKETLDSNRYYLYSDTSAYEFLLDMSATVYCKNANGQIVCKSGTKSDKMTGLIKSGMGNAAKDPVKNKKLLTVYADMIQYANESEWYFAKKNPDSQLAKSVNQGILSGKGFEEYMIYATQQTPEMKNINQSVSSNLNSQQSQSAKIGKIATVGNTTYLSYKINPGLFDPNSIHLSVKYTDSYNHTFEKTVRYTELADSAYWFGFSDIAIYDVDKPVYSVLKTNNTVLLENTFSIASAAKLNTQADANAIFDRILRLGLSSWKYFFEK